MQVSIVHGFCEFGWHTTTRTPRVCCALHPEMFGVLLQCSNVRVTYDWKHFMYEDYDRALFYSFAADNTPNIIVTSPGTHDCMHYPAEYYHHGLQMKRFAEHLHSVRPSAGISSSFAWSATCSLYLLSRCSFAQWVLTSWSRSIVHLAEHNCACCAAEHNCGLGRHNTILNLICHWTGHHLRCVDTELCQSHQQGGFALWHLL